MPCPSLKPCGVRCAAVPACRSKDATATQAVDSVTAQLTRAQEGLRIKRDQMRANTHTIDNHQMQVRCARGGQRGKGVATPPGLGGERSRLPVGR